MRSQNISKRSLRRITLAGLISTSVGMANAQISGDCDALANMKIENTNLLSATVVPAKNDLPEYCRVLGFLRPAINFEIRLPTANWNGKFYMRGCGGWCGELRTDGTSLNYGLRRNYAISVTDTGHWGKDSNDVRWAYRNPVARFDFAQRSVTETARVTKEIIKSYYKYGPNKSYFAGCSTGGRQGIMEAWRYSEDFDGIISGAPGFSGVIDGEPGFSGDGSLWYTNEAWQIRTNTAPDGSVIFPREKIPMLAKAVYSACAGRSGLISDPRQCHFQPETLQCDRNNSKECLTALEVEVLRKLYGGAKSSQGVRLYDGLPYGSEPYWDSWVMGKNDDDWRAKITGLKDNLRFYGFDDDPGPDYNVLDFDFDKDPMRLKKAIDEDLVADGTDLGAFKNHGGKLLLYHGWADQLISPQGSVRWYEALTEEMGGAKETQTFARLFMIPGMDHCGGNAGGPGVGRGGFDPLPALENWVEKGIAPASIIMTKTEEQGKVAWTQPVCAYPKIAKHQGTGAITDAANWVCSEP
jgi:feruloyl esterase